MSENKIGFALVHEICPICGKPMNEQILMNSVLSKKYAKEIENVHGKAIGYSKTACEDCSKYKDEAVMCIAIDEAKSEPNNPYRTGQVVGVCKDFQLFVDKPEFIIKTENGVSYCFVEENIGKQICNASINSLNRNTKGYYKKDNGTYQVQICINGKRINIGTYKTEEEAANVYNNYKNKYIENHANFRTEN